MDGAESTLNNADKDEKIQKPVEAAIDEAPVSEYAKWMDGAETTITKAAAPTEEDEEDQEDGPYEDDEEEYNGYSNQVTLEKRSPSTSSSTGTPEERAAQEAVNKNKERTKELEKNLGELGEEHLGYASLIGKTISRRVSEFTYKIAFFSRADQDHTSLGTWKGFTGPRTAEFSGGASCWQGPQRMLKLTFECGLEEAIQDVIEPSRCVYAATMLHPAACDPTEVITLQVDSRVVGPKDEL